MQSVQAHAKILAEDDAREETRDVAGGMYRSRYSPVVDGGLRDGWVCGIELPRSSELLETSEIIFTEQ